MSDFSNCENTIFAIKPFAEEFLGMSSLKKYSIFFLLLLVACSTEPIETGPFRKQTYKCDLNGLEYVDYSIYESLCTEEHAKTSKQLDSLLKEKIREPTVTKNCVVNEARLISKYYTKSKEFNIQIIFDTTSYIMGWIDGNYWMTYNVTGLPTKKYQCPKFLPPDVDSTLTIPGCSDTLGLRSIIDVFENFPDSLCEELTDAPW